LWTDKELFTSEVALVQVASDRLTYRVKGSQGPEVTTMTWTADQKPCRSQGSSGQEVCVGGVYNRTETELTGVQLKK